MKRVLLVLGVMLFGFMGLAKADIFAPIGESTKAKVEAPSAFDDSTLLTTVTAIVNYLGVK